MKYNEHMDVTTKDGLYRAGYQADKVDPDRGPVIEDLEAKIAELEDIISDLKVEISGLESRIETKTELIANMRASVDEMNDHTSRFLRSYKDE